MVKSMEAAAFFVRDLTNDIAPQPDPRTTTRGRPGWVGEAYAGRPSTDAVASASFCGGEGVG